MPNRLWYGNRIRQVLHDDDDELPDENAEGGDEQRHPNNSHRPGARRACNATAVFQMTMPQLRLSLIAPTNLWQAVRARPAGEVFHETQRRSHLDVELPYTQDYAIYANRKFDV